ncbi:MAG: hypothetical protein WC916_03180 [Candidatus Woesearchaeota archaeon]
MKYYVVLDAKKSTAFLAHKIIDFVALRIPRPVIPEHSRFHFDHPS